MIRGSVVVGLLLIVASIVCVDSMFGPCFVCLDEEWRAGLEITCRQPNFNRSFANIFLKLSASV